MVFIAYQYQARVNCLFSQTATHFQRKGVKYVVTYDVDSESNIETLAYYTKWHDHKESGTYSEVSQ